MFRPLIKTIRVFCGTLYSASTLNMSARLLGGLSNDKRERVMISWGRSMLKAMGMKVQIIGEPHSDKPCLYIGNHISYMDIPLLMSVTPVVFIAKKELETWPLFGMAMKTVGTPFVDRDSKGSRIQAANTIAPYIQDKGFRVAVFPAGTTTLHEEKGWRWSVFALAKRHGFRVIPFRIRYEPLRAAAYIDEDFFPSHFLRLASEKEVQATIEFHPPITVEEDAEEAALKWHAWTQEGKAIPSPSR